GGGSSAAIGARAHPAVAEWFYRPGTYAREAAQAAFAPLLQRLPPPVDRRGRDKPFFQGEARSYQVITGSTLEKSSVQGRRPGRMTAGFHPGCRASAPRSASLRATPVQLEESS